MKNVKLELSAIELIELKQAIASKAREHFVDNNGGIRKGAGYNYSIHSIQNLMTLYDKVCYAYNESLEED